jgi:CRISPR-associated protein Csd2
MNVHTDPTKRHQAVLIFDVMNGNINGDPDMENLPRTDPETEHGWVSDVCLKRKVRNFVQATTDQRIFIEHGGASLNSKNKQALEAVGAEPKKATVEQRSNARDWMCQNYWDIRMFGAMLATGKEAGEKENVNKLPVVTGPVQLQAMSASVDRVLPIDTGITRGAVTKEEDLAKERTIGRKTLLPYGLFISHWFFDPYRARETGVTEDDLTLLWEALEWRMWEIDRSAARGLVSTRGLYVFSHDNPRGNAPAHKLFELISVDRDQAVDVPRSFGDYTVRVADDGLPQGVTLTALVEARQGVAA